MLPPYTKLSSHFLTRLCVPPAICVLVNIVLSGDFSGEVAPSSSLEISKVLAWARFSSFISWLSLAVPLSPLRWQLTNLPFQPYPTYINLFSTSSSITPLPAQGQLGQNWAPYFLYPPPSPFLPFSIIFLISPPSLLPSPSPRLAMSALPFILLLPPSHVQADKI